MNNIREGIFHSISVPLVFLQRDLLFKSPSYLINLVFWLGYAFEETLIEEAEEPAKLSIELHNSRPRLTDKEHGILPGFRLASNSDYQLER